MNKKTCYVTTPIYYASGSVHIGNSYTTTLCDAYARYNRLKGNDTHFLTGMDEFGQKVEEAALSKGMRPKEYVDKIANLTQDVWKELEITNTDFIQTTETRHMTGVQKIFERLLANDDIYLSKYEGDYCVSCETFYTKTQITVENTCPDCGKPLRKVEEESYFLRLKKYAGELLDHINKNPDFIQPETRKNEVISFIKQGLEDLSISRTTCKWGIPVLSNPKHVVYVWIDALSNYITALGYGSEDDSKYQKYWVNGDIITQVVAKDILRFHAIIWPIMLIALGIPLRFKLFVHGWYLMQDGKMSKSKGNVIYPQDVISRYGLDPLRLYLIKEMPFGNDSLFSFDRFVEKYNADLANDLGNLVSRTMAMINKYFNGTIKKPTTTYTEFDKPLQGVMANTVRQFEKAFDTLRLQSGLNEIWNLISKSNKYVDDTAPWIVAKDSNRQDELNSILYHLYEALRLVSIMISSVMPNTALQILTDLGVDDKLREFSSLCYGLSNMIMINQKNSILFKRLDPKEEEAYHEKRRKEALEKLEQPVKKPEITIDDFDKLDLRIGEVLECSLMEGSDKLLVFKIKVEDEVRQIVSGIAKEYKPEELIGKKLVVLINLKARKLRGVESQGMILSASDGKTLEVLQAASQNSFSKVS